MWTLDPIDGTKGFVRGEQYAVCLALIEDNDVKVSVIGCPNLPASLSDPGGERGCLFVAVSGQGAEQVCPFYNFSLLILSRHSLTLSRVAASAERPRAHLKASQTPARRARLTRTARVPRGSALILRPLQQDLPAARAHRPARADGQPGEVLCPRAGRGRDPDAATHSWEEVPREDLGAYFF